MTTSAYGIRELVEEAQVRWLKPVEVLFILQSYEENQLTHKPPQKPPSGSLFLFDRKALRYFRRDGHSWRKKKDGKNLGEAHERLKVGNVEILNCYYAHGEENPNFQRRCFWMLNLAMEHIVLVHYRDTTMGRKIVGPLTALSPGSSSTPVQSSISYASHTSAAASSEPSELTLSPTCIEVTSSFLTKTVEKNQNHFNIMEKTEENGGSKTNQALKRIEEQLSLDEDEDQVKDIGAVYSENEDSYDSGLTVEEQSHGGHLQDEFTSASQQTSFWKDMLIYDDCSSDKKGTHLIESRSYPVEKQENCCSVDNSANGDSFMLLPDEHTKDMYVNDPDFYPTTFDQKNIQMPLSLTIAQEHNFTIREISPGWGYANESTKVLVVGTFTCECDPTKCEWICMFGDIEVPIEIIQEGVISCEAPPFLPGKVTVCITSNNHKTCSGKTEFEYRDKKSSYKHDNPTEKESDSHRSLEELLLLVRLVQMLLSDQGENMRTDSLTGSVAGEEDLWAQAIEALLDGSLSSLSAIEWVMEELLKDKLQQWLSSRFQENDRNAPQALSRREQGIIHMVSGLGFWWALKPILNSGVGINFRDINGWTALHWAARFGREKMVAELLASGALAGAITDPSNQDPAGKTPASVAFACGHKGLAGYLSEMSLTDHLSSLKLSADLAPQTTLNNNSISFSNTNPVMDEEHLSLKDTLAAVRNATQVAARIQSAFRAHSFSRRQQKESCSEDEYGLFSSDIEGLSMASKLTFGNGYDHHYAALSIQKKYRGWKGRKDFVALRHKVVRIQAYVRGHQVRKSYKVICWAVGIVEKVILRWRRKGTGLRGFHRVHSPPDSVNGDEDEDVIKAFRKQKVDVAVGEAVARVLSMVDSQPARQQYRRMLQNHNQAKAELGVEVTNMEKG